MMYSRDKNAVDRSWRLHESLHGKWRCFFTIEGYISISTLFQLRIHISHSYGTERESVYEPESACRFQHLALGPVNTGFAPALLCETSVNRP